MDYKKQFPIVSSTAVTFIFKLTGRHEAEGYGGVVLENAACSK